MMDPLTILALLYAIVGVILFVGTYRQSKNWKITGYRMQAYFGLSPFIFQPYSQINPVLIIILYSVGLAVIISAIIGESNVPKKNKAK